MKILVTGADGMLGSNLVRELLGRGHEVVAFLLPGSTSKTLDGLPILKTYGNILTPAEIGSAAQGCDAIIHTAANTNIWPDRSEMVRRVNFDGTKQVVEVALKANVRRFIYVGTANSFGFGSKDTPGDESHPYQSAQYGLDYMDSKYQAQQYVLKAVQERNLPAIVINPTFMLGSYDSKPGAGAMIIAIAKGKVPGYAAGGRNYVYVKDVAIAIANALAGGRLGECYIAGHENLNYREAFGKIARVVGVAPPRLFIPSWLSKLIGWLGSMYGKLTGNAPTVSLAMARISADEHYFTARKAIAELGMPQTDIEVAIRECYTWLKDNNYL